MVQFFIGPQSQRSMNEQLIGEGIGKGVANIAQRQSLINYLNQAQQQAQGAKSPIEGMFALMKAGAGIPGSEKYLATLLPAYLQQMQTQNLLQSKQLGTDVQQQREPIVPQQKMNLPGFLGAQSTEQKGNYPNIMRGTDYPGNAPTPASEGVKLPILKGKEIEQATKNLLREQPNLGYENAHNIVRERNEANRAYNQEVEKDLVARREAQKGIGAQAEESLTKLYPEASDELKGIVSQWGEEALQGSKSEGAIKKEIAGRVQQLKNTIASIKRGVKPARLQNLPGLLSKGQTTEFDKVVKDTKTKLKPLLDLGLYDTARSILSNDLGYYPEEIETFVSDLSEPAIKNMSKLPVLADKTTMKEYREGGILPFSKEQGYPQAKVDAFENNLKDIITSDPNVNLVLLRKKYEAEKGVDWRLFKDGLNKLENEGIWSPNADQQKQLDTLESPPVGPLYKLLQSLNIIGR